MPRGHIANPKLVNCATCKVQFLGLHYASKYCSQKCEYKNYYQRNRKRMLDKGYRLKKDYKLSWNDYLQLLIVQDNKCAICQRTSESEVLCVDHCHKTGQIRGLLCRKCNMMLGLAGDSIDLLQNSVKYLKKRQGE